MRIPPKGTIIYAAAYTLLIGENGIPYHSQGIRVVGNTIYAGSSQKAPDCSKSAISFARRFAAPIKEPRGSIQVILHTGVFFLNPVPGKFPNVVLCALDGSPIDSILLKITTSHHVRGALPSGIGKFSLIDKVQWPIILERAKNHGDDEGFALLSLGDSFDLFTGRSYTVSVEIVERNLSLVYRPY